MNLEKSTIRCLIEGFRGTRVPQRFAKNFKPSEWGIPQEVVEVLREGPEHSGYWAAWERVLDTASCTDNEGHVWRLYQRNCDLFAIRDDSEFSNIF